LEKKSGKMSDDKAEWIRPGEVSWPSSKNDRNLKISLLFLVHEDPTEDETSSE
jgi:hypothetical protein